MNKAFVREPDAVDPQCPRCGVEGERVPSETLTALLTESAAGLFTAGACFCPTPNCDVAYYDDLERTALVSDLRRPVFPKDQQAPLCPCFGLTIDDVEDDILERVPKRIRALVAQSKGPDAHCATASPTGRCCLPEVQRYYFRRKAAVENQR